MIESIIALLTLASLEIILGIDNIIFLNILVTKLPEHQQVLGRKLGLGFALITRLLLLFSLAWMIKFTSPLFSLFEHGFSLRDLILVFGGIFLVMKAAEELIEKTTPPKPEKTEKTEKTAKKMKMLFLMTILQIGIMDIIFSLDSVITAVGMASDVKIMAGAIIIAMAVMLFFSEFVGQFIKKHIEIQILGLAILVMVGGVLTAEGFGHHFPKMFIYATMGFAFLVNVLQIQHKKHYGKE